MSQPYARAGRGEPANTAQTTCWNEQAGPKWARRQRELDAQLEPIGRSILEKLAVQRGERVLDVGCGAGATTLAIAELSRPGEVVGLDVSAPLLARASERASGIENVCFVLADAQTHRFEGAGFDALFSRFGVMFFDEPVRAFTNLREALAPGGRLGFVCWRAPSENPIFTLPIEAASRVVSTTEETPEASAPGPFAFADASRVEQVLTAAGWAHVELTPHDVEVVYAGTEDLETAVDLALEIGPLSRLLPSVDRAQHAAVRAAVREAFVPHLTREGVMLPAATWLVTARREQR